MPLLSADEEIALAGIEAMESFYHSIGMPINMKELGIEPTEEQILEMAHRCALATGGQQGSAKVLNDEDMAPIYRMARSHCIGCEIVSCFPIFYFAEKSDRSINNQGATAENAAALFPLFRSLSVKYIR